MTNPGSSAAPLWVPPHPQSPEVSSPLRTQACGRRAEPSSGLSPGSWAPEATRAGSTCRPPRAVSRGEGQCGPPTTWRERVDRAPVCRRLQQSLLTGEESLNGLSEPTCHGRALAPTLRDPHPGTVAPRGDLPVAEASWPPVVKAHPRAPTRPPRAAAPQQVLRSPSHGETSHPAATLTSCCPLEALGGHLGQSLQDSPGESGVSGATNPGGFVQVSASVLPAAGGCRTDSVPAGGGVRARG